MIVVTLLTIVRWRSMSLLSLRFLTLHVSQQEPLLLSEVLGGGGHVSLAPAEAGVVLHAGLASSLLEHLLVSLSCSSILTHGVTAVPGGVRGPHLE